MSTGNVSSVLRAKAEQYETAVVTGPTGDRDTSGFYCELRPKRAQIPKWDTQFPKWDASLLDDVGRVIPDVTVSACGDKLTGSAQSGDNPRGADFLVQQPLRFGGSCCAYECRTGWC